MERVCEMGLCALAVSKAAVYTAFNGDTIHGTSSKMTRATRCVCVGEWVTACVSVLVVLQGNNKLRSKVAFGSDVISDPLRRSHSDYIL